MNSESYHHLDRDLSSVAPSPAHFRLSLLNFDAPLQANCDSHTEILSRCCTNPASDALCTGQPHFTICNYSIGLICHFDSHQEGARVTDLTEGAKTTGLTDQTAKGSIRSFLQVLDYGMSSGLPSTTRQAQAILSAKKAICRKSPPHIHIRDPSLMALFIFSFQGSGLLCVSPSVIQYNHTVPASSTLHTPNANRVQYARRSGAALLGHYLGPSFVCSIYSYFVLRISHPGPLSSVYKYTRVVPVAVTQYPISHPMMSLSVSSFPEPSKLAINSKWEGATSSKSRRCFFGTLFSKGSGSFLKGVRQLEKTHVKDSVVHPVGGAAASPSRDHSSPSQSSILGPNIVIDIIAIPDTDDSLATPTSHDVSASYPDAKVASSPLVATTPLPPLVAAEHDPATLARVFTKAPHLPRPPSAPGVRAHTSFKDKNTPSPAKVPHLTVPDADVEQRNPQSHTLFNLKSSSTVSLVGSSEQGRVPEALPPVRGRCKSETATSRAASTSPGGPRKSKRKGKAASPRVSPPGVSTQARSRSDVLHEGAQRGLRQNDIGASSTHQRTPSDQSSTSSTLVGQTPLLVPPLLSVHISHMRSGSRPTPTLLSSHRLPKTPSPIRAARTMPVLKSTPPPLPDRPTITITMSDEDGTAPPPRTRPAQQLPPPHVPLITSDSDPTVDSDPAGSGARSAAPSFLAHESPQSPRSR